MKSIDLERVRADGWLEQLAQGSEGFMQLCEIVGEKFVAFSVIAGVRITALTVDPRETSSSLVEYEVGDDAEAQRIVLREFRQMVVDLLLNVPGTKVELAEHPTTEQLQAFLGFPFVMLSAIFDVQLDALEVDGNDIALVVTHAGVQQSVSLPAWREALRDGVRAEGEAQKSSSPFAIDLSLIPEARRAMEAADYKRLTDLLEAWPGPLSMLLRTPEGQTMSPEVRGVLAEALGMLGTAYSELGRGDWGAEVIRLAIQWGQDSSEVSAMLFQRLGDNSQASKRFGESIGYFRRALSLGGSRRALLPRLARAFLEQNRPIAAMLCAQDAIAIGVDTSDNEQLCEHARERMGDAWANFRALVPESTSGY